jgi:DNA-binding FadR family transcriptional regulator
MEKCRINTVNEDAQPRPHPEPVWCLPTVAALRRLKGKQAMPTVKGRSSVIVRQEISANGSGLFRMPPRGRRKAEILANEIRRHIIMNRLLPGAQLPSEATLIADTGFSRATVREAQRLLEADGLIAVKSGPGGGITVRHPSIEHATRTLGFLLALSSATLGDLLQVRKMLEPAAAELAADVATREQRDRLLELAASRSLGGDLDFHLLLARCTGNELLRIIITSLDEVVRLHIGEEGFTPDDLAWAARAHLRVASAIDRGDGTAAREAMLRHLVNFEKTVGAKGRLKEPIIPPLGVSSSQS